MQPDKQNPNPKQPLPPLPRHVVVRQKRNSGAKYIWSGLLLFLVGVFGIVAAMFYFRANRNAPQPEAVTAETVPETPPAPPDPAPASTPDESPETPAAPEEPPALEPDPIPEPPPENVPVTKATEPLPAYTSLTYPQFLAHSRNRFNDRRWAEHQQRLLELVRHHTNARTFSKNVDLLLPASPEKILPAALAQIAFIQRAGGAENMNAFCEDNTGAFISSMFGDLPKLEKFLNALDPNDNLLGAMRVLAALTRLESDTVKRTHYENLAMALALVHDRRENIQAATTAYKYYKEKLEKSSVKVPFKLNELLPDELVWAVAPSRFSYEDYEWAFHPEKWRITKLKDVNFRESKNKTDSAALVQRFKNTHGNLTKVAAAYGTIRYESNTPYGGNNVSYSMENILRFGGICEHQTAFTVGYARAHMVPVTAVGGVEPSGIGHAWALYRDKKSWKPTGRLTADAGTTWSPQSGKRLTEAHFAIYADPARENGKRATAKRLQRAALALSLLRDNKNALQWSEAAVNHCPTQFDFWENLFETINTSSERQPPAKIRDILARFTKQFAKNPDFIHHPTFVDFETKQSFSSMKTEQIRTQMRARRREIIRQFPNRFDLVLNCIESESEQLLRLGKTGELKKLLNDCAEDFGATSMRDFERLLDTLLGIVRKNQDFPDINDFLRRLMSSFERHHHTKRISDFRKFAATAAPQRMRLVKEREIAETLATEFERIGKSPSLRDHARRLADIAQKNIDGLNTLQSKIEKRMTSSLRDQ